MILDCIFLSLVCYKSYEHYRSLPGRTWRSTRLMNILVRDSMIYFFTYGFLPTILCARPANLMDYSEFSIFFTNILIWSSTLVWKRATGDLLQLGSVWATIFPPAVAARLILNIRKEFRRTTTSGSAITRTEYGFAASDMVFELPVRSDLSKGSRSIGLSSSESTGVSVVLAYH